MTPINYTLDVQQPFQAAMQGYQAGAAIRNDQQQQQAMLEQQRQQQLAAQQQAAMNADLSAASRDPRLLPQVMVKYPQLAKDLKHGWDAMTAEQQNSQLSHAGQVLAAIESGRPDIAINTLRERATALRNGGDEQGAKAAEDMARLAEMDPAHLSNATLYRIAPIPGGDKIIKAIGDMREQRQKAELHGPAVRKATADATAAEAAAPFAGQKAEGEARTATATATTAETTAKFSERKALLDLEEKGWNIKALQNDIEYKKQANRIAAMNAASNREGNTLKRQELQLKIDEARAKLDGTAREKVAEFDQKISGVTDARTLISEIKDLRKTAWVNPTGVTAMAAYMPASNARSQSGKIEQLKNTLTLDYLDKLKGPTSDNDIKFLKNIAANLDTLQSDPRFATELEKVDAALQRVDAATRKKYGAPPVDAPAPREDKPRPSAAPAPGQVQDGYRFKGGNPADQKNWEKVR